MGYRNYATANGFIVAKDGNGDFNTIGGALTAAQAIVTANPGTVGTIFIRPGTYIEDNSLVAGWNLTAFTDNGLTPNVTISGKCTFNTSGTVSISGVRLSSNGAEFLAVTGSSASIVNLNNCYLITDFDPGITYSSSSSSSGINIIDCGGDITAAAKRLFNQTSAGGLGFYRSNFGNSGLSTTPSLASAGGLSINNCTFAFPITTSGTSSGLKAWSLFDTGALNVIPFTAGGATSEIFRYCSFGGGSASAFSATSTNPNVEYCTMTSTELSGNAVAGSGTISYGAITFDSTAKTISTSLQSGLYTNLGSYKASKQPCFSVVQNGNTTNQTGDSTVYTLTFGTSIFDQGGNFSGTTFTAPVTGRYLFTAAVCASGLAAGNTDMVVNIATTARSYQLSSVSPGKVFETVSGSTTYLVIGTVIADMTAGHTATVNVAVYGGTKIVGTLGGTSYFMGSLIC